MNGSATDPTVALSRGHRVRIPDIVESGVTPAAAEVAVQRAGAAAQAQAPAGAPVPAAEAQAPAAAEARGPVAGAAAGAGTAE